MTPPRWVAAIGLIATVATSCSTPRPGTGVPIEEQPLDAAAAMGDLRTVDACATFDLAGLNEFGIPRVISQGRFDSCRIAVIIGSDNLNLTIGETTRVEDVVIEEELQDLPHAARMVSAEPLFSERCRTLVIFADDIAVESNATPSGDIDREQACEVAQAASRAYFDAVVSGGVVHWEPPNDSLARISACGLHSTAEVSQRLGVDEMPMRPAPSEHSCEWTIEPQTPPLARIDFEVSDQELGQRRSEIAGRETTSTPVRMGNHVAACAVFTPHIPYSNGNGGEREYAALRVWLWVDDDAVEPEDEAPEGDGPPPEKLGERGEGEGERSCEIAEEIAAQVWPKLPDAP